MAFISWNLHFTLCVANIVRSPISEKINTGHGLLQSAGRLVPAATTQLSTAWETPCHVSVPPSDEQIHSRISGFIVGTALLWTLPKTRSSSTLSTDKNERTKS